VNDEKERLWKREVMAYFNVLSQNFPRVTEEKFGDIRITGLHHIPRNYINSQLRK